MFVEKDTGFRRSLLQIFSAFRGNKDELIPIMEAVQNEIGYIPETAMRQIADFLKLPEGKVYWVATFYALFKLKPAGNTQVRICKGTACHVRDGEKLVQDAVKLLGINPGENTPDLKYGLETISCFGSCALAPVIVINNKVYGRMTTSKIKELLDLKVEGKNKHELR